MTLELHFSDPTGGFFDMLTCRHHFRLEDGLVFDSVRAGVEKWRSMHPAPVILSRVEFSAEEWRTWTQSSEYTETFAAFVAERSDRTSGLSRVLGEFLGCDDVACGAAPRLTGTLH